MVALCCILISVYSATLNSLGYAFAGEISTQRLRPKTSAISFGVYASLSLIMAYICPYMLSDLEWGWGLKTGLFFGAGCTLAFVVILFFAPETKGRALKELDEMFQHRVKAYRFSKYETTKDRQLAQETTLDDRQSV